MVAEAEAEAEALAADRVASGEGAACGGLFRGGVPIAFGGLHMQGCLRAALPASLAELLRIRRRTGTDKAFSVSCLRWSDLLGGGGIARGGPRVAGGDACWIYSFVSVVEFGPPPARALIRPRNPLNPWWWS